MVDRAGLDDEGGLLLVVTDTGGGISTEDLPKVLLPFAQVDGGLDRKHEGIGLGLSLAKTLTERLGGRSELESERGTGTRAMVRCSAGRLLRTPDDVARKTAADAGVSRRGLRAGAFARKLKAPRRGIGPPRAAGSDRIPGSAPGPFHQATIW